MENIKNTNIDEGFLVLEEDIRVAGPIAIGKDPESTFYPDEVIRRIEAIRTEVEKTGKIPDVVSMDIPEEFKARVFELFNLIVAQNERP